MQRPEGADVKELAIHRRLSRLNYSRRCAEASAMKAYQKRGLKLSPGMEIGYVVKMLRNGKLILREMPLDLMLGIMGSC
jgi:hypothetical protein